MKQRQNILLFLVVIPGLALGAISGFFLFPDWTALDASHRQYQQLARTPSSTIRDLSIAQAGENRHRINCFAEGIGVLLGGVIAAIGIHGICTLPDKQS